jgi:hypothetical protein
VRVAGPLTLWVETTRYYGARVIPQAPRRSYFNLPDAARMPLPGEMDGDGLGLFQGVWLVDPGPIGEARDLIAWERSVVATIDGLADSPEGFDALAHVIEDFQTDGDDRIGADEYPQLTGRQRDLLRGCLDSGVQLLDGLDLGVAGLVVALASTGFVPAASCRGHTGVRPWAAAPAVIFAGDHDRVAALRDMVPAADCSLDDASGNGEGLVVVRGSSVVSTMGLADSLLDSVGAGDTPPDR